MQLPTFFRNEGRTVRTWIKKQNVEFCDDRFERLVCCWWEYVENGGNGVEYVGLVVMMWSMWD